MKHLLSIEKLARADMELILAAAVAMKRTRGSHKIKPLAGQTWALIFSKSSTRTRVSFEVGISELGGRPMFLSATDIQLGRGEPIKDTARVLGRMVHGAIIRTFAQSDVEEFAEFSKIPTINALTDEEHPCQVLADIFTFQVEDLVFDGSHEVARQRLLYADPPQNALEAFVDTLRAPQLRLNIAEPHVCQAVRFQFESRQHR